MVAIRVPVVTAYARDVGAAAGAVTALGDDLVNNVAKRGDGLSASLADPDGGVHQSLEAAVRQLSTMADRVGRWSRNVGYRMNDCSTGVTDYVNQAIATTDKGVGDLLTVADGKVQDWTPVK